ncbi:MAG: FAD-dependent oxidoreductase [Comamonadaceae bacterium]|nr:MAG: FAD-dependent oxidoreductase [Comamonadaceae bacterium]
MHVCVLGAGIVGLATAYVLSEAGHEVTILDRASPGQGASGGNGAQLSYSYVQPLADPAIWKQLPKLLLSPTSPLKIRPQPDVHQWLWGLQFMAACNAGTSRDTTVQLLQLAAESRAAFDVMMAAQQLDCDYAASGKLVMYRDEASFAGARRQLALQKTLGSEQQALTPGECAAIEPALAFSATQMAGGIHTPSECAADCYKVCLGLARVLRERGVKVLADTAALKFVTKGGRAIAVQTAQGDVAADAFVLALGADSPRLARTVGVHLPVYPLKGYSLTLDVRPQAAASAAPTVSVTDAARKVVFARIGDRLRVAGMAELVGYDMSIEPAQIESLKASTRALFPECSDFSDLRPWAGMRPATPTGLPVIGRQAAAPSNLFFNTGHGALGFTLAFGSATRIAGMVRA